jgi:hypothetical protein
MTPKATINAGLVGGDRSASLALHAGRMYERGGSVLAVAELVAVEKNLIFDDASKKDPTVKLRIEHLEVAPAGEPERTVRDILAALHTIRTANGTINGDEDVKLSEQTLSNAAGVLGEQEAARLRVILDWFLNHTRAVIDHPKHRAEDIRRLLNEALDKAVAARDAGVQLDLAGAP